ncbi:hypothetical protein GCM10027275_00290 [Rhabdobacter roseus]|uniref:Uncharacterized protein n=1 Tax=Rhabdobacter roseus TaxID=1655419 RepID=A0A840TK39_9BACT|nr:hypothetical protein [Rhabdobacter roseus]MBB5281912.1 hypothetical protein [Rhabdobacter roseus]
MIVDTIRLCWGVVVHAANIADGQKAHLLAAAAAVEHCLGYLDRMQKFWLMKPIVRLSRAG